MGDSKPTLFLGYLHTHPVLNLTSWQSTQVSVFMKTTSFLTDEPSRHPTFGDCHFWLWISLWYRLEANSNSEVAESNTASYIPDGVTRHLNDCLDGCDRQQLADSLYLIGQLHRPSSCLFFLIWSALVPDNMGVMTVYIFWMLPYKIIFQVLTTNSSRAHIQFK